MKKIILIQGLIVLFSVACNQEPDAKAVKKEVLNIHDKLMMDGEKVVKNRMKIDSVLKNKKIKSKADSVKLADLVKRLNNADEKMMDWMHFFNDDFKGKNEKENLNYFKSEMIKIRAVEDSFIQVTRESDSVLKNYNIAPAASRNMEHHKH